MGAKEAAGRLRDSLARDPNVQSVGHTDDKIVVYTVKKTGGYPADFEGFPVEVVRAGKLEIKSSKKHGGGI